MILSTLSEQALTNQELKGFTLDELRVARAELLARGGRDGVLLTPIEAENLERIRVQEVYARHAERILNRMTSITRGVSQLDKAV
jgi:hypothetical protein